MTFKVTVQPAGRTFEVEQDETILSAAIRQGIGLPYGCKDGACSSCKCRLLDGQVVHGTHQQKALSDEEQSAGLMLSCCARPQTDVVLESRQVAAVGQFPVHKMPVRVRELQRVAPDVMVLQLQLPANQVFQYYAGQYIEFILRDGTRRSYSMANAAETGTGAVELHIRHMPGGVFTDHVFGAMKEKEILRMEGPFGSFFLREDNDRPIVLLASGTGFAPIKAIIEHMRVRAISRPAVLYWGCRCRADLYLHDWAERMAAELPWLRYVPVLSDPKAEDAWGGRTGFVHRALMDDLPDLSAHEVYACGAPVMVEAAQRDLVGRCGLPEERFFADAFTSEADKHGA